MKKIIILLIIIICTNKIYSQKMTVLFTIEQGMENEKDIIAIPFAIYNQGIYHDPPTCDHRSLEKKVIAECNRAEKFLLPVVKKGQWLYTLKAGKKSSAIKIIETIEFGYADWRTYSGKLQSKPNTTILTNNSALGTQNIKTEIKNLPKLKVRKDPEGYLLKNKLIEKLDIDGDGIAELIYECDDYEGKYYEIYSFKNNAWKKVYKGGYQGV